MNILFNKTAGRAAPCAPRIAVLFFACFTLSTQAQTNVDEIVYSTSKEASIALTAIVQTTNGGTSEVRVTTKDILAALNATGLFNFTNHPKLFMRSDNGGLPYFIVRDSETNEFDVSGTLSVTSPDDAVHGHDSKFNWAIWNVTFSGGGMDFAFWSLTTLHTGTIRTGGGGILERTVALTSVGSGPGHVNGANAQFAGEVIATHAMIDSAVPAEPGSTQGL